MTNKYNKPFYSKESESKKHKDNQDKSEPKAPLLIALERFQYQIETPPLPVINSVERQ